MRNVLIVASASLLISMGVSSASPAAQPNPNVPSYSPYSLMQVPPAPTWRQEGRSAFVEPGGGYNGSQGTYDNAYPNATSAPGMDNPSNY